MKMRGFLVLLGMVVTVPVTAEVKPLLERHEGREPGLNELRTVGPGEAIYQEFDYPQWLAAKPASEIVYTRNINFNPSEVWLGFNSNGKRIFCGEDEQSSTFGGGRVCVVDDSSDGTFDRFAVWQGAKISSVVIGIKTGIKPPVPYTTMHVLVSPDIASEWKGNFFRQEILYEGAGGGVLRLLYREFVNDLVRAAFSQELTFDLAAGPMTVSVKGARVEVIKAGNEGIEYRMLQGFKRP